MPPHLNSKTTSGVSQNVFIGAWGDKVGRKVNILLGITGICLAQANGLLLSTNYDMNLFLLFPLNIASSFSGFVAIIPISCFAYLADITLDNRKLTRKMVVFSAVTGLAGIVGGLGGAFLVRSLSYQWIFLVSLSLLVLDYLYTMLRLRQIPPSALKKKKFIRHQSKGILVRR